MPNYEFEIVLSLSDLIDVEADNVQDAMAEAERIANEYQAVLPAGYGYPWDNIDVQLINSDGDDW